MTLDRRAAVEALARAAFAAELLDDPRVDARAASGLSWALRSAVGTTEELVASGAFERLDGMNATLWAVTDDALHGRFPPLVDDLEQLLPRGLLDLREVKGLGPKKIRALWKDLEVTSIGELEYACRENRLVTLKGFGDKTQQSVLSQIEALRAQAGLMRLDAAHAEAAAVAALLLKEDVAARVVVTGELRRFVEIVSAVRLVARTTEAHARRALEAHAESARVTTALLRDEVDGDVRLTLRSGAHTTSVRVCLDDVRLGWAILEETGSEAHVEALRTRARERGLVLSALDAVDEVDVYDALGLIVTAPERREQGVPLVERGRTTVRLVERADLRGALHNHTDASDGTATLEEMRAAAIDRGLTYLGITDHSQSATYAHGLDDTALADQRARIASLNQPSDEAGRKCALLSGVESDILRDGALDYPTETLRALDVVVASVHNRFGQRGEPFTARMVAAARHACTDVVGHPTGRLLLGRAAAEFDVSALLDACAEAGCAVELNANPARLDLNERHLAEAKERGVLVSIAADAHAPDELDALEWGIAIARRAGLRAEDVLNSRTLDELRAWLGARRTRAGVA